MISQNCFFFKERLRILEAKYGKEWLNRHTTRFSPTANLFAGGLGGLCSLVVGYPFDTVKVRLQTSSNYSSAIDCLKKIVIGEGFFALFRGISALACVALPRFALMFHTNAVVKNLLNDSNNNQNNNSHSDLNYRQILLSGALSQLFVVPLIVAPLERAKVILQTNNQIGGQFDCVKHIVKTEGIGGVFRGTLITYARDMPSFATYFLVYEYLRHNFFTDPTTGIVGVPGTIVAGATAGIAGWTVAIPADVIKSRLQARIILDSNSKPNHNLVTTIAELHAQDGFRGFFRGAGPVLLRAGPANAAAFLGYEASIVVIAYLWPPSSSKLNQVDLY